MTTPLRLLILEDNPADFELVLHTLRLAGYDPIADRVETEQDYRDHLDPTPEIILADFSLPEFDSLRALEIMQERKLDIPFIIVSGTIGEDRAVQVMQRGATDYIIKDRLARLGPAVNRALAGWRLKEEKRAAEQMAVRLAAIVETSGEAIVAKTLDGVITSWNPAAEKLYGYPAQEIIGRNVSVLFPDRRRQSDPPEDLRDNALRLRAGEHITDFETVRVRKDGCRIEVRQSISPIREGNGPVTGASTIAHDITQRKRSERFLWAEQAVTDILTGATGLEESGSRVLQTIAECLRWEVAILWTVDRKADVLNRLHIWHSTWAEPRFIEALSRKTVLEPGAGVAGRTWETGRPVWEAGIRFDGPPAGHPAVTFDGLRGGFGLPMRQGADTVGVIEFYSPELREPDAPLLATLDKIASQISQFCERRRTEGELRASEERTRSSLREKEVLLKEIHHRVKNNLQIVSALLDLQSRQTTDAAAVEMFRESRGRVRSMALIHERLYRAQDLARVDFAEYTRQLASDLFRTYKVTGAVRLELDVDIPSLTIDIAIPCGLVLNELISNCLKHAFTSTAAGCIRVSLRRDGGANVLTVADDGTGFPAGTDFRNATSFGLQLVNTLVDQLDGESAMTADRGTTFTVRFPKSASRGPGGVRT
ncbi:PAS domain S-box protein [Gemmata sp. G18]|uniref:PAS domain S-box protein n=1 Tax=Gemmata palustris TaxID=2822762 RepID=A0ABS5BMB3_9BACT|nr:response regulator [Gemmata palustris]MBP3954858.1 PAS domain S-box protein [Gemmata palustris]